MNVVTPKFGVGASVLRLEDQAFLTGNGRYTDDIQPEGLLHGYVLRSPFAKARFSIVSTESAMAAPGVHLVLDFGVTVNPILLAGQVHGGVVQGIGQALTEEAVYGEDGQLISASFMDYAMPRADMLPSFHFETRNVPSTTNALGIKGAGEAGTIGSTPAALNAVTDALWRAYGIGHIEMPATPARVWQAIQDAKAE